MSDETSPAARDDAPATGEDTPATGEDTPAARDDSEPAGAPDSDPVGDRASLDDAERRRVVRDRYGDIAADPGAIRRDDGDGDGDVDAGADAGGCGCCGGDGATDAAGTVAADSTVEDTADADAVDATAVDADAAEAARQRGYSSAEVAAVASGANLGLGCGNPTAIAGLERGQTVLDLGAGGGFDCFLAAEAVGPSGRVIGVDMTPEMVERARGNVAENDAEAVEFRLGEIKHLPVADATVDVVISNCVLNLSPDKPQALREAHRVLRPGGRLAISDVVRTAPIPVDLNADPDAVAGCVAGAATIDDLESMLADAGFTDVAIEPDDDSDEFIRDWDADRDLSDYLVAATIEATKPAR